MQYGHRHRTSYNSHEVPGKAAAEASWQPESARVSESVEIAVFLLDAPNDARSFAKIHIFRRENLSFCLTEFEIADRAY